jgi:hypothetical protein
VEAKWIKYQEKLPILKNVRINVIFIEYHIIEYHIPHPVGKTLDSLQHTVPVRVKG